MKKSKVFSLLFSLLLIVGVFCTPASAESTNFKSNQNFVSYNEIVPYADVIQTKYRLTADGIMQYRRWNATWGYWVDPYWISL